MLGMTAATVIVAVTYAGTQTKADLLCPKGSLSGMLPTVVWSAYVERNSDYVNGWLRRLAENLAAAVEARSGAAQLEAAAHAGEDNGRVMTRMFEEGFIAATDIISAHCLSVPDHEPWDVDIQRERQNAWCKEWSDAHFCPVD